MSGTAATGAGSFVHDEKATTRNRTGRVFMGAADIGGSVPANLPIGATLGTAFAIAGKLKVEEALVIAVPAAVLGHLVQPPVKARGSVERVPALARLPVDDVAAIGPLQQGGHRLARKVGRRTHSKQAAGHLRRGTGLLAQGQHQPHLFLVDHQVQVGPRLLPDVKGLAKGVKGARHAG